jgi:predicted Zn finger-like uncharacterized protein
MTHTCPHCASVYEVTWTKVTGGDRGTADCAVCGKEMAQWNSSSIPEYRLIKQPEGAKE